MAQENAVNRYLELRKKRDALTGELSRMGQYFSTVGQGLSRRNLRLGNSDLSVPIEIQGPSVDYNTWPEKEHAKERLQEFYKLHTQCRNAYFNIPEADRRLVEGPE